MALKRRKAHHRKHVKPLIRYSFMLRWGSLIIHKLSIIVKNQKKRKNGTKASKINFSFFCHNKLWITI